MVIRSFSRRRACLSHRILSLTTAVIFAFNPIIQPIAVFAQGTSASVLNLPAPGSMVSMSNSFTPLYIKGITVDPNDPLKFSFIVNSGDTNLQGEELKAESEKLIKYFLTALTVPENELWVNLSPYERANMIPERFGYTEMGRDLLAQDYMLKQITASIMYPEGKTGSTFWNRVQQKVKEKFGMTDVPVNMFNKIWIIPDKAEVYEINGSAYVVDSHLKVMLDEDYFSLKNKMEHSKALGEQDVEAIGAASSQAVREVLLPEIEKEVNEGKNFANLRQIYNANILATWYKMNLRDSLLGQVYIDKNKVSGVDAEDKSAKLQIYEQYVAAFKKGAYEMVKKDYDPATQQVISRKYFAGGVKLDTALVLARGLVEARDVSQLTLHRQDKFRERVGSSPVGSKDFDVTFQLGVLDRPVVAAVANSPARNTFSETLASALPALSSNPTAAKQNISVPLRELLGGSQSETMIAQTAQRIIDLSTLSPVSFTSSVDFEKGLINMGESPEVARIITDPANLSRLTSAATSRVDAGIAPLAVAARVSPADTESGIRGVLETNAQTRAVAPQVAKATVRILSENPGAGQDRATLVAAVKQAPELKGVDSKVIDLAFQDTGIREMTNASTSRVDKNIAPIFIAIKVNRQESQGNMEALLRSSTDSRIRDSARQIAFIVAEVVDKSPDAVMDMTRFATAVQSRMRAMGMNRELIGAATAPSNMNNIINAALSPVEIDIASLPTKMSTDREGSQLTSALGNIQGLALSAQDVSKVAQAMQKIGTTSAGSFSNPYALRTGLMTNGVSDALAGELAKQPNISAVAKGITIPVDYSTSVIPTLVGIDREGSKISISAKLSDMREIGSEANRLSEQLVEIATTAPGLLSSRETMKRALMDRGISERAATAATQDLGLRRIALAIRQTTLASESPSQAPGGIDINPALLKLLVKRDGNGVPVPVGNVNLKDTDIYGFEPVIFKIEQVDNLPAFIGIEEGPGTAATVRNLQ